MQATTALSLHISAVNLKFEW